MKIDCKITENYFKERNRMLNMKSNSACGINCDDCRFYEVGDCVEDCEASTPLLAIDIVQKWSDEHQEMTNLDYLLKHFPNTKLDEDGTPSEICPDSIGLPLADGMVCKGNAVDCKKCWSRLYEEK